MAVQLYLSSWGSKELDCPGISNCTKIKMSPKGCHGCPKNAGMIFPQDVYEYLPYLVYLLEQLERIEMHTTPNLQGFDMYFIMVVKHARDNYFAKIKEQKYLNEKEVKK